MTLHWLNPGFLWALPLALLPLLLLLRRQPAEPAVVPFAATQLLEKVAAEALRQERRQQWWQTVLRVLVLALVVLAFARPVWRRPAGAGHPASGSGAPKAFGAPSIRIAIRAEPREFIEAALGWPIEPGALAGSALVFLGAQAADLPGLERHGLQTGEVAISGAPYCHPALEIFNATGADDLWDIRVRRWWRVVPTGKTITLVRLANGDPFLVETLQNGLPTLVCTVAPDPGWGDLPLSPQFVPFVRELVRYLEGGAGDMPGTVDERRASRDLSRALLALGLFLALVELLPGGFTAWKLLPLAGLVLLLAHPTFSWQRPQPHQVSPVTVLDWRIIDQSRADAVEELRSKLPVNEIIDLVFTNHLAGLLRREPGRPMVLVSAGHLPQPADWPAWVAARRPAPVFTVAVGDPSPPPGLHLNAWRASRLVFGDEQGTVEAAFTATGYRATGFPARILLDDQDVILQTTVSPGRLRVLFPVPRTGMYRLDILPPAGETAAYTNSVRWGTGKIADRIRVWLEHDGPTWEYRHARHALAGDPGVRLADDPALADVSLPATGDLWRLRRYSDEAFVRLWRSRVRQEWQQLHPPAHPPTAPAIENSRPRGPGRNDSLLKEIARVSGGDFFTAETIDQLPAALRAASTARQRFDLRNSLIVLLALLAAFTVCWGPGRPSADEGNISLNPG